MKYEVMLREIDVYIVDVEADSEDEALQLANKKIESEPGKAEYYYDSHGEYEVLKYDGVE